jgi:hypothetical protein
MPVMRLLFVASLAGLVACQGQIGANDAPDQGVTVPDSSGPTSSSRPTDWTPTPTDITPTPSMMAGCGKGISPGPSPLRRLTPRQYDNIMRDLLGDTSAPARRFASSDAELEVTQLAAEQYGDAAEALARKAVSDLPGLLGCDPGKMGEDACVRAFLPAFGLRAYRRPLTDDEQSRLLDFYLQSKAAFDFATGVRLLLQAMLQSPHFLYHVEIGQPLAGGGPVARVSGYERAARLSFLFWGSLPDQELLKAAASGALDSPQGVADQARRLLRHQNARNAILDFHDRWLQLEEVRHMDKNTTVFKTFSEELRSLLARETELFVEKLMVEGDGKLETLLRASHSFMNRRLAAFYGVSGPSGEAFEKVQLDPMQRTGVLTHAGLLGAHSGPDQTSPVARGIFVRNQFLCSPPPPPPEDADIDIPIADPKLTTRQRFAQHQEIVACAACHKLMDPVGFGLLNYDGVGLWRDTEAGVPIDARGEILAAGDADGTFDGPIELARRVAGSRQARECLVSHWFQYGYGRSEGAVDQCTVELLQKRFTESGGDVRELMVALTQTDAFLYRTTGLGTN